jgi:glucose/arabinose dehydrogenase
VFATDGTFLRAFGGYGSGPGQLIEPVGIAIGPDGNVYVADSGNGRINTYTRDGQFLSSQVIPDWQGQLERVNYLAFGPNGVLFATTPSTGEVLAIGNGQAVPIAGPNTKEEFQRPMGLAVDANGSLLVADAGASRVVEFTPEIPEAVIPSGGVASPVASPQPTTPEQSPPA